MKRYCFSLILILILIIQLSAQPGLTQTGDELKNLEKEIAVDGGAV